MMSLIPFVLALAAMPAVTEHTDDAWLRFVHGRSKQVFERTVPCDGPTTFRFAIGKGAAMRAEARVSPRGYRDDSFAVTSSVLTVARNGGHLVGTVPAGIHEFTVWPTCGSSARAHRARVLLSLQLRAIASSARRRASNASR